MDGSGGDEQTRAAFQATKFFFGGISYRLSCIATKATELRGRVSERPSPEEMDLAARRFLLTISCVTCCFPSHIMFLQSILVACLER